MQRRSLKLDGDVFALIGSKPRRATVATVRGSANSPNPSPSRNFFMAQPSYAPMSLLTGDPVAYNVTCRESKGDTVYK